MNTVAITADQLIYSNFLPAYSPAGIRGYQTVCASKGLSKEDRTTIESLVANLPDTGERDVRWQFFFLPDGRPVMTRSQRFPADAEISDPRGTFVAHAAVVSAAQFAGMECNPFRVMDGFPFVRSAKEVVSRFGARMACVPQEEFVPFSPVPETAGHDNNRLCWLLELASRAEGMRQSTESAFIRGGPPEVERCLRLIFVLTHPAWRGQCTFTTLAEPATCPAGRFWAVGGVRSPEGYPGFLLPGAVEQVSTKPDERSTIAGPAAYLRWLRTQLRTETVATTTEAALVMQQLTGVLDESDQSPATVELTPELCLKLSTTARTEVHQRVRLRMEACVSAEVVNRLMHWMTENLSPEIRVRFALGKCDPSSWLSSWAFHWVVQDEPKLSQSECDSLRHLAQRGGNRALEFLAAIWRKPAGTFESHRELLDAVVPDAFVQLLKLCPSRLPPSRLAGVAHGRMLLAHAADVSWDDHQVVECLEALAASGYPGPFDPLAARVDTLDRWALCRLLRLPERSWRGDLHFKELLFRRCQYLEERVSGWRRLWPWPRRLHSRNSR